MPESVNSENTKPEPVTDEDKLRWRRDELHKFERREYNYPPWNNTSIGNDLLHKHLARIDPSRPGYVTFYETHEKGVRNIVTRMRPGRYLKRYANEYLSEEDIERFSNQCREDLFEIHYVHTNIEDAFVCTHKAARSCMSYPMSHECFSSDIHPTSLYDDTELSVALLVEKSTGSHKGRAVVWQDKKLYNRAYGNAGMLEGMLHKEGYTRGQFIGIEFPIIFHGDRRNCMLVLPFVDREERGGCYARIKDKDTVVICQRSEGQFELSGPGGVVEVPLSALRKVGLLPKAVERMGSPQVSETSQNPFRSHPSIPPTMTDFRIVGTALSGRFDDTLINAVTFDEAVGVPDQPVTSNNRDHRIYGELLAGRPYTSIEAVGGPPEEPYEYHIFWSTNGIVDVVRRATTSRAYEYIRTQLMSDRDIGHHVTVEEADEQHTDPIIQTPTLAEATRQLMARYRSENPLDIAAFCTTSITNATPATENTDDSE